MSDIAVRADKLGKCYRLYPDPGGRILEWATRGRCVRHEEKWALRDVSFELPRGSALGVIGANGAGKSTLLKVITGTTPATTGTLEVNGRLGSLLELGAGFHPAFTGRDNVFMNAAIKGIPKKEVKERFHEVEEFAELGEFMDRPVRTYSSGMSMRLGFSVAMLARPEILILDEILAVGDQYFQGKCLKLMREIREAGTTILFVSHSTHHVRMICDHAIWLHNGILVSDGDATRVTDDYVNFHYAKPGGRAALTSSAGQDAAGVPHLDSVKMCPVGTTDDTHDFTTGDVVDIHVSLKNPEEDGEFNLGVIVTRDDDVQVFTSRSKEFGQTVRGHEGGLVMRVPLDMTQGEYYVSGYLLDDTCDHVLDQRVAWHRFRMHYGGTEKGIFLTEARWLSPHEVAAP